MTEACYWVAVDDASQKVVELDYTAAKMIKTRHFRAAGRLEIPSFACQGIGRKLVDFALKKADSEGKKFLQRSPSNHPNHVIAQLLYDK